MDEPTYRELMWVYARKGQYDPARAVHDRMVAAGITPDDRHEKALAWASGETQRRLDPNEDASDHEETRPVTDETTTDASPPPTSPPPPARRPSRRRGADRPRPRSPSRPHADDRGP